MTNEENAGELYLQNVNSNLRDLEERQRILKDRLVLIGQNLIEIKEKTENDIINLKKSIEEMKQILNRTKDFIEAISGEFSKFAKKEDVEILRKQAKIFQPMEFATKKDLEKLKKN
jgi:pyruvate/2-oxoglutarate dehydrogenase complex dihydrolipoamide dehydrogenase (E3) component